MGLFNLRSVCFGSWRARPTEQGSHTHDRLWRETAQGLRTTTLVPFSWKLSQSQQDSLIATVKKPSTEAAATQRVFREVGSPMSY